MKLEKPRTPVRRLSLCTGVLFLLMSAGCESAGLPGDRKDRTLELAGDTIELPAGVDLHDVQVRTGAQYRDFDPNRVEAKAGDYLRFTTADSRTHALVFEVTDTQQRDFLESKGQLRSPPLVSRGTSWVVALAGAPAGNYPFRCLVHNDRGQLVVGGGSR